MTPVRAGLLVLLVTAGCQKPAPIAPAQVRGTVTFQGRPLAGGLIVFTPERGEKPFAARLDKGGRYELEPAPPPAPNLPPGVSQGVPPGFYQVSFSDGLYREDGFPSELRRPDTSLTTCEVLAGQENVLPFHITADGGVRSFSQVVMNHRDSIHSHSIRTPQPCRLARGVTRVRAGGDSRANSANSRPNSASSDCQRVGRTPATSET